MYLPAFLSKTTETLWILQHNFDWFFPSKFLTVECLFWFFTRNSSKFKVSFKFFQTLEIWFFYEMLEANYWKLSHWLTWGEDMHVSASKKFYYWFSAKFSCLENATWKVWIFIYFTKQENFLLTYREVLT